MFIPMSGRLDLVNPNFAKISWSGRLFQPLHDPIAVRLHRRVPAHRQGQHPVRMFDSTDSRMVLLRLVPAFLTDTRSPDSGSCLGAGTASVSDTHSSRYASLDMPACRICADWVGQMDTTGIEGPASPRASAGDVPAAKASVILE